jgi:crotonobetainyl-CoA:carnitine CoA-transferase CaiB-like acyl-CoA transferase
MEDPRFLTLPDRMRNIDELEREIEAITTQKTTDEWIAIVDKAGVPCGPVLTYDETWEDPQVLARDMVAEVEHPIIGPMKTIAPPTKFSDMEFAVRRPAPWLGQHTAEVLREAGISDDRIAELFKAGALYDAHPDLERPEDPTAHTAETRS